MACLFISPQAISQHHVVLSFLVFERKALVHFTELVIWRTCARSGDLHSNARKKKRARSACGLRVASHGVPASLKY